MLRTLNQRFNVIAVLLLLLFGVLYAEIALFLGQISAANSRALVAASVDSEFRELQKDLWELRYWEKAVLDQSHPKAEQRFGQIMAATRRRITNLGSAGFIDRFQAKIMQVSELLTHYEDRFNHIIQLKTEQRLNRTNFDSNYDALVSSILMSNEQDLIKPLFNLYRLQQDYFNLRRDSQHVALGVVFASLKRKMEGRRKDARLEGYLASYQNYLERDHALEKEIRVIEHGFDKISQEVSRLFPEISELARTLSRDEVTETERLNARFRATFLVSLTLGILMLFGIIATIAFKIVKPVRDMSNVVQAIQGGDSKARFKSSGGDEIARLGYAFNDLLDAIEEKNSRLIAYQGELESTVQNLASSQEELKKHRENLTELVTERTAELTRAVEQMQSEVQHRRRVEDDLKHAMHDAEVANKAKSEFLANMSHEIRTPMNGILGMTELLLGTDLTADQEQYLRIVKLSADSLLAILNDILDLSKIEAGRLELDEVDFDLHELLGSTLKTLAVSAYEKGLELAYHVPSAVPRRLKGDPARLRQIIVNLVGNAVKFTERGEVVVRVELDSPVGKEVTLHFTISDTGIGITREQQRLIFQAFCQADGSASRKHGGTGLGLSISSQLVAMMGGKIWVHSELGHGAEFHFTPRFAVLDEAGASSPEDLSLLKGVPVLVVEDNLTNRGILEEVLRGWHMRPTAVADCRDARVELERAAEAGRAYRLMILDRTAGSGGTGELLGYLGDQPHLVGSVILMVPATGEAITNPPAKRSKVSASALLTKPLTQSELLDAILSALDADGRESLEPAPASRVTGPEPARQLRILLAEDNMVNRRLAVKLLESRGHSVMVAETGEEAVVFNEQERYDVILMDVQMPAMNGLEATRQIRRRERKSGRYTPIIAMTAHAMKGDRERCLDAGMDGYVPKPIVSKDLFEAIDAAVAGASAATEEAVRSRGGERREDLVFDPEQALDRLDGDLELFMELIGIFLESFPKALESIRSAIEGQQSRGLEVAAHTLKGSLGNFDAERARELAQELELMGHNGQLDNAGQVSSRLEQEVERLARQLADYRSEHASQGPAG